MVHGDAVVAAPAAFVFHARMWVRRIEPPTGTQSGGTLVRVLGSGFDAAAALVVRVGTHALVRANVLSSTMLECVTPSQTQLGVLALELSANEQDFSADEVLFEYQPAVRLDDAAPARGPSSGGSSVALSGAGFSRRSAMLGYTYARFNTTKVPVVRVSASELRCTAPAHASGLVSVEVTQNDQQYTESAVRFEYEDVGAYRLDPATGPVGGGTTVLVRGAGLHEASPGGGDHGAFCQFAGLDVVGASFDGEGTVRCVTPATSHPGAVALHVVHGDAVVAAPDFLFMSAPQILTVLPALGTLLGSTPLVLRGSSLAHVSFCRFRLPGPSLSALLSLAVVSSSSSVFCDTPKFPASGFFSIELGFISGHFTESGLLFEALPVTAVDAVTPIVGPTLGGMRVQIFGSGFSVRTARLALLACRFNTSAVPADFIGTSEIACVTTSAAAGIVTVEVSNDARTFSSTGVHFTFQEMRVLSVHPTNGPAVGGARLCLRSTHFCTYTRPEAPFYSPVPDPMSHCARPQIRH